jgi:septum formation inhibitor MinC
MATDTDQTAQLMQELIQKTQEVIKKAYDASTRGKLYGRTFEQTVEARRVELTAAFKRTARESGAQNDTFGEEFMEILAEIIIDAAVIQAENPNLDPKDIYAASIRRKLKEQPNVPDYMVEMIILADKETRREISEDMLRMNDADYKAGDKMEKALDRYMTLLTQSGLPSDLAEKLSNRALSGAMIEVLYNLSQKDEPLDIRQTLESKGIASDAINNVETSILDIIKSLASQTAKILEGTTSETLDDLHAKYRTFSVDYLSKQGFSQQEAERIFKINILESANSEALSSANPVFVSAAASLEKEVQTILARDNGSTIPDPWQEEEEKKEPPSQTGVNTPPPVSKSTQPAHETTSSDEITVINRDIAPDERLEHTGPVKITGNIGQGAHVTVTDGSIKVTGNIHDNAQLKTIGTQNTNVIHTSGGGVTVIGSISNETVIIGGIIGGNNSVIMTSRGISKKLSVTVDGHVGNNVTIDAAGGITVNNNVGNGANFSSSQGDIVANDMGGGGRLHSSQGDVRVHDTGDRCTLDTGQGSVRANRVGQHCTLRSGQGSVNAEFVEAHSSLQSGQGSVSAGTIHQTVQLHSGMGSTKAGKVVGETPSAQTSQDSFANAQIVEGSISGMGNNKYNGDVIVTGDFSAMGNLTSSGSIRIQGSATGMGNIKAEGDIVIYGSFSGMGNVTSKNGNVYLGGGQSGMGSVRAPNGRVIHGLPTNETNAIPDGFWQTGRY